MTSSRSTKTSRSPRASRSRHSHPGPPTIREVAALAGVSIATVSRVVNQSSQVAPETRQRVQQAITHLGFVSSPAARAMRPGVRSLTWGLLVDELSSGYFGLLVSTTQKRLEREVHLIREMARRKVDGLFVVAGNGDHSSLGPHGSGWGDSSVPLVYLDRIPSGQSVDVVTFDYYHAVQRQVERLWQLGHRRLGYIAGEVREDPGSRRFAAFRDTVVARGGSVDESLISVDHVTAETAGAAAIPMLDRPDPATALVCTTSSITLGIVQAMVTAGLTAELAAGEDFEGGFLAPFPLHVIQADLQLLAQEGATLLLDRIADTGPAHPVTHMLATSEFHHGPDSRSIR